MFPKLFALDDKLGCCVDVGCGSGQFTKLMIPFAHTIIGRKIHFKI